jgi:exodeoxyribonuclease VII large subunit
MKHLFAGTAARLEVLSPLKTLSRGYAIAATGDGTVVTDTSQLAAGDHIRLHLHRGRALCRVEELETP